MTDSGEVTQLLEVASAGDSRAMDRLVPLVYGELQRIAHRQLSRERADHTLEAMELVNESYLKLVDLNRIKWQNRAHFFAIAAQAMRRILVDHAIRKKAQKRGGDLRQVTLDEAEVAVVERRQELLALDDALRRLGSVAARHSRVVECRFFGGMSIQETAEALGVSAGTVKRDWSMARAWLTRELCG